MTFVEKKKIDVDVYGEIYNYIERMSDPLENWSLQLLNEKICDIDSRIECTSDDTELADLSSRRRALQQEIDYRLECCDKALKAIEKLF